MRDAIKDYIPEVILFPLIVFLSMFVSLVLVAFISYLFAVGIVVGLFIFLAGSTVLITVLSDYFELLNL